VAVSSATCAACGPGTFSTAVGAISPANCTSCAPGAFSWIQATYCVSCLPGSVLVPA
jgi:hypothetical protein